MIILMISLNPCCSGQWSRTINARTYTHTHGVLILVVVDNGLVPVIFENEKTPQMVLILVVVDNGLVQQMVQQLT